MKKILVVLLVLAVATGVFAQEGEWSVGGKTEIGVYVDLDPVPGSSGEKALYKNSGYWSPYHWYGPTTGVFEVNYTRDALKAGFDFDVLDISDGDPAIGGYATYNAGNFAFEVKTSLAVLAGSMPDVQRLWGYYKLLNEMIHLEVAYDSRDTEFWISDKTAGYGSDNGPGTGAGPIIDLSHNNDCAWKLNDRNTFTKVDHGNYLLADVQLENLSFGVMLNNLFMDNAYTHGNARARSDAASGGNLSRKVGGPSYEIIENVLKKAVFGVKFNMQPIEIAAQFRIGNYGAYLGGKVFFGPVDVGLSFAGLLDTNKDGNNDDKQMKVGGGATYNADAFSAGLSGFYAVDITSSSASTRDTQIGIEPFFEYNVIPTHLKFRTDVGFYFNGGRTGPGKDNKKDLDVKWGVQPQLFWNFLGTGAGSYYGFSTGMIVRYRLVSDATNAFDVSFKFGF
jgi:hypothetical protein